MKAPIGLGPWRKGTWRSSKGWCQLLRDHGARDGGCRQRWDYDVLIVGTDAYADASAGVYAGSLFYGHAGIEGTMDESDADVLFASSTAGYWFVSALSDVDVDADGHDDVVIGNYYDSTASPGDVFFFSGATLGTAAVYGLEEDADLRLQGDATGDYLGYSVAAADTDMDGHVEMFVSASGATLEGADRAGCVYMIRSDSTDMLAGLSTSVADAASFKICASIDHARLGRVTTTLRCKRVFIGHCLQPRF